jgi:hypothetical protein
MTMLDNLTERSGDGISFRHNYNFERLHLRYLEFEMRQFLWKGTLFDPIEFQKYKVNMEGPNAVLFKTSPDEVYIFSEINRIFNEQDWTGDLNKIIGETA